MNLKKLLFACAMLFVSSVHSMQLVLLPKLGLYERGVQFTVEQGQVYKIDVVEIKYIMYL